MMITFRKAELKDLPAITEIYNHAVIAGEITATLKPVTIEEQAIWFAKHSEIRPLLVACQQGKIIGWASLSDFYGRVAYEKTVEVSIYLAKDAQGLGLGAQCLSELEKIGEEIGLTTFLAFIFSTNQASCHLFEKFGYQRYGFLPQVADTGDKLLDLIIFGKRFKK
ncbi:GNAT family N-acetyltransferase [Enterococcus timonensis]|uniref:GNAT family N-acetyltransferase n=1 Tax=Enterococcus timonensis TaxID=1852364 RepID=UPI0008D94544|nr:GNAT family N-acetyltransferase [Enterococcus timonensis]